MISCCSWSAFVGSRKRIHFHQLLALTPPPRIRRIRFFWEDKSRICFCLFVNEAGSHRQRFCFQGLSNVGQMVSLCVLAALNAFSSRFSFLKGNQSSVISHSLPLAVWISTNHRHWCSFTITRLRAADDWRSYVLHYFRVALCWPRPTNLSVVANEAELVTKTFGKSSSRWNNVKHSLT